MLQRLFVLLATVLGLLSPPPAAHAESVPPPGPEDTAAARKAGRDAGPAPETYTTADAVTAADAAGRASYRVFATQYHPNTAGSVEVAVPDKCAKFAALGWTSALSSSNCPSGYKTNLDWRVLVRRDSGQQLKIALKDVGPWNVDDNYWNGPKGQRPRRLFKDLPRGTPESQAAFYDGYNTVPNCTISGSPSGHAGPADQFGRCVLNPAGIDLSVEAAKKLGIGNLSNEWVTVTFLWERTKSPQSHVLWHNTNNGRANRWVMGRTKMKRSEKITLPKGARFPKPTWTPVATGDFNRDGNTDILWRKEGSNALRVWLMKGSTRIGRTRLDDSGATMTSDWRPVGAADFDRDGHTDIAWHNASTGRVAIWYLKRTTRKSSATLDTSGGSWPSTAWSPFATADVNRNGRPDIAWHNAETGRVMIWYLVGADGDTLGSSNVVSRASGIDWPSSQWKPAGAGEFNRDGTPDILWHNTSNGTLVVWTMGGGSGSNATDEIRVTAPSFPPPNKVPIVWQ